MEKIKELLVLLVALIPFGLALIYFAAIISIVVGIAFLIWRYILS